jgi:ribosomal-protein-alanine N-acetyltransferase
VAVIRRARPEDAEGILALRVLNRQYLEWTEPDTDPPGRRFTDAWAREWAARDNQYVILDDGEVCGSISLQSSGLGYWVAEAHAGKGLATRAVAELADIAFRDLGLHRLEAGARVDNPASQRVLEKNRFTLVGTLRQHLCIGGEWVDHLLFERIAGD